MVVGAEKRTEAKLCAQGGTVNVVYQKDQSLNL